MIFHFHRELRLRRPLNRGLVRLFTAAHPHFPRGDHYAKGHPLILGALIWHLARSPVSLSCRNNRLGDAYLVDAQPVAILAIRVLGERETTRRRFAEKISL
jgi:hypothetical protein